MHLDDAVFSYQTRRGKHYGVRLRIEGKLWQRQGFRTRIQARAFRDKIRNERFEKTFFPDRYQRSRRRQIVLPEPILEGNSARQRRKYTNSHLYWRFWTSKLKSLPASADQLRAMLPPHLGPASRNRYLSWLHKTTGILVPRYQEPKAPPYYFTREQEQALYRELSPRDRDICRLTLLCLLRQSELFSLRKEWIDWENGRILLPDPKAREPQYIQVPCEGMQILRRLSRQTAMLSSRLIGGRADTWYKSKFRTAVQRAGLPSTLTFHTIRHTGPGRLAAAGVPDSIVQALGRWKTPSVVQRYTHHANVDLKAAAEKLAGV